MQRAYGVRPVIYAPADIFLDVLQGAFADYPLWVRGVGGRPSAAYGSRRWAVWQHTDTGRIAGIAGDVDRDCYDDADARWLGRP